MFLVARTPRKTVGPVSHNGGDIKELLERRESPLPVLAWGVSAISGIILRLHWKSRTFDKLFVYVVLTTSGIGMEIRFTCIWVIYSCGCG